MGERNNTHFGGEGKLDWGHADFSSLGRFLPVLREILATWRRRRDIFAQAPAYGLLPSPRAACSLCRRTLDKR
jgi:hypothetical protein